MKKTLNNKPEVVLASFPRSGNTFLRNILMDVFGVYSWNNIDVYHKALKKYQRLDRLRSIRTLPPGRLKKLHDLETRLGQRVIKTHDMPDRILPKCAPGAKIIYLVRDGRDALVSMAHHRKDIIAPGSDFQGNLRDSIRAAGGSFFGGWGKNVSAWLQEDPLLIYFEMLVEDPGREILRIRDHLNLAEPDLSKIPTFETQRAGGSHFGGKNRDKLSKREQDEFNSKFFRSGKSGTWKQEMPPDIQETFWEKYGDVMLLMGYQKDGTLNPL